ncbi:MAG: hypothetical protein IJC75_03150 [Oscillospiraceae bacterium]|nr:hypothetical protein [Oscillospiraceae bacterium]
MIFPCCGCCTAVADGMGNAAQCCIAPLTVFPEPTTVKSSHFTRKELVYV